MTSDGLVGAAAPRSRAGNLHPVGGLVALAKFFRPADGWLAVAFLTFNLLVVIWSVEHANWVPMPNLKLLLLMAIAAGILFSRVPIWGILVLPVGAALGLLTIVWQITSFESRAVAVTSADQLWSRLGLWLEAATTGSINIDSVPFAFAIMCATWLAGFLAAWSFFRYRNFWGVFVLGGAGLLSNLTYLPPDASRFLLFFLFTGLLLIARVQSVRRRREWDQRNVTYDGHLGILSISDNLILALVVILVSFAIIPVGGKFGPTNDMYEYMRTPLKSFEGDFNRLFAGLPARRPLGYRIWGDVLAFQGEINPTKTQVLWVESPVPLYWKARTYATYTAKGWKSDDTVMKPIGWTPPIGSPQPYKSRFDISYSVTPRYSSKSLFAGDQVIDVNRPVQIEVYDSPTYTVDLTDTASVRQLPPPVARAAVQLQQARRQGGLPATLSSLAARLPDEFRVVDHTRSNLSVIQEVVLADVLPHRPDILSVRSKGRDIKARDTYEITSSVSSATPRELRNSGTDYPAWVMQRYTQLPDDFPPRVRDLSARLTGGVETPYDKAQAIKAYLTTNYPYTLIVDPPPFNADGVEHFLFEQKKGYSEYFASAMTVMLRSVDVPARMVTGYTTGEKAIDGDIYVVLDSNSHGWLEVYMPDYGWIPFEATPGRSIPRPVPPKAEEEPVTLVDGIQVVDPECLEELGECDPEPTDGGDRSDSFVPLPFGIQLVGILLWLAVALAVAAFVAGVAAILWRKYMVPSGDPQVTFRRLVFLATLGSLRPVAYQTPFQYRQRLTEVLPSYREQVSVIIDHYVRHKYGKKELDDDQRLQLAQAWLRVRVALLLRIFQPRNSGTNETAKV